MNVLYIAARRCMWLIRGIRRYAKSIELGLRGADVGWSVNVHPDAVLERSGGSISIGANTFIDRGVIVRALGGAISIGSDCSLNAYTFLSGSGGMRVGNSVRIASHVAMVASNHVFSDPDVLIRKRGLSVKGVQIEDDV